MKEYKDNNQSYKILKADGTQYDRVRKIPPPPEPIPLCETNKASFSAYFLLLSLVGLLSYTLFKLLKH